MPWAIDQHSRCVTEAQRERWAIRLTSQLANWRSMTTSATGALGAVGLAIGGAGAIVVGGTSALVRGAVQGAKATSRALTPVALEDQSAPAASESIVTVQKSEEVNRGEGCASLMRPAGNHGEPGTLAQCSSDQPSKLKDKDLVDEAAAVGVPPGSFESLEETSMVKDLNPGKTQS